MNGAARPESDTEHDLMSTMLDEYTPPRPCKHGDIIEGVIVRASAKGFLVDIGGKCDAMVHPREVEQLSAEEIAAFHPGQILPVYVLDAGDKNNVVAVSLTKAAQQRDWQQASQLLESGASIELQVVDCNKGGTIVHLGQLRGFVPGSQLLPSRRTLQKPEVPARRWEALIGETLLLKVIEVTPQRNRLIFSERNCNSNKIDKKAILRTLEVGSVEKGIVSNVVDFGAFVNVKGVDGLLHISELSWRRVNHPSEVVQPGQQIEVYILGIDLERERLNLSIKQLQEDPWDQVAEIYAENQLVEVKIVNTTSFGAFACPVDNPRIEGLIHISELSDEPVVRVEDIVHVGMVMPARVISLRPSDRRIAFSLKQVKAGESVETETLTSVHEAENDAVAD